MPQIKVYGGNVGSSLRVHWMLKELGLAYETIRVDLRNGEHKKPEFLMVNPAGQIPAIDVDGFRLAESVAIAYYLAEKYNPTLLGSTPEIRAKGLQWTLWTILNVQKPLLELAMQVWNNAPDEVGAQK